MNSKDKFLNTLKFKKNNIVPNLEISLWPQTILRWEKEGFPKEVLNEETLKFFYYGNDYLKLEDCVQIVDIDVWHPYPKFKEVIIEENNSYKLFIDDVGRKRKALKTGTFLGTRLTMDQYIDFPVKDKDTFNKYKKYFEGSYYKRYPSDYKEIKANYKNISKPLMLLSLNESFGYYSMLRRWMGTENLSYMFFDNPNLIHDCCEFLTDYFINLISIAVKEIKFDFIVIHEDMSYKNGPLMSPSLFMKFFQSHYKKVVSFLKSSGVELVIVDTDGNFEVLIPLFLEAGIDGFFPMEVAAGMDPVSVRKKYGKSFSMIGGVDKRELAKDKISIKSEIDKLVPVIAEGGYIPCVDHMIPPDVSLQNFLYYLELKKKAFHNYAT